MVRSLFLLSFTVFTTTLGAHGLFSVHDDLLAYPQYEVHFPQTYITEAEAEARLASAPPASSTPAAHSSQSTSAPSNKDESGMEQSIESYEALWLSGKRYLCSVPVVKPPPPMNATEKEISKAAEEKELARATTRGWELLSELDGQCLYFISGWWSYSFCHNRDVRQFHQLPPQNGAGLWPPTEDPQIPSYVLGQVPPEAVKTKSEKGEGTELQATGESKYLVQKMGGGTICDLTGKDRKIEVQFHCNPNGVDRIGWIKEVSICCYLMVVYTPRLCGDVAFLPPRDEHVNGIQCREIMNSEQVEKYYIMKAKAEQADALRLLQKSAKLQEALGVAAGEHNDIADAEKSKGKGNQPVKKVPAEEEEDEDDDKFYIAHREL